MTLKLLKMFVLRRARRVPTQEPDVQEICNTKKAIFLVLILCQDVSFHYSTLSLKLKTRGCCSEKKLVTD